MLCFYQVVDSVLEKYPSRNILVTGHSLGCALTGMMAVNYASQDLVGVCFSMPGTVRWQFWFVRVAEFCHEANSSSDYLGILDYTSQKTSMSKETTTGIENLFVLADSNDPLLFEGLITNQLFGKVFFMHLDCSSETFFILTLRLVSSFPLSSKKLCFF